MFDAFVHLLPEHYFCYSSKFDNRYFKTITKLLFMWVSFPLNKVLFERWNM